MAIYQMSLKALFQAPFNIYHVAHARTLVIFIPLAAPLCKFDCL